MLMYQVDPSKLLLLADLSLLFVFFFSVFSFAYYVVHEATHIELAIRTPPHWFQAFFALVESLN